MKVRARSSEALRALTRGAAPTSVAVAEWDIEVTACPGKSGSFAMLPPGTGFSKGQVLRGVGAKTLFHERQPARNAWSTTPESACRPSKKIAQSIAYSANLQRNGGSTKA